MMSKANHILEAILDAHVLLIPWIPDPQNAVSLADSESRLETPLRRNLIGY